VRLPHISNFSDFNPLKFVKGLKLKYLHEVRNAEDCDIIILPGSKNTIKDMKFLEKRGFAKYLKEIAGEKPIIAICGGFQMLGRKISDPKRLESDIKETEGLGLIPSYTEIQEDKELKNKEYSGKNILKGITFSGYEIHMGRTVYSGDNYEFADNAGVCVYDSDKKIFGTYIHGIFENADVTRKLLSMSGRVIKCDYDYLKEKDERISLLADLIRENIDVGTIVDNLF